MRDELEIGREGVEGVEIGREGNMILLFLNCLTCTAMSLVILMLLKTGNIL